MGVDGEVNRTSLWAIGDLPLEPVMAKSRLRWAIVDLSLSTNRRDRPQRQKVIALTKSVEALTHLFLILCS